MNEFQQSICKLRDICSRLKVTQLSGPFLQPTIWHCIRTSELEVVSFQCSAVCQVICEGTCIFALPYLWVGRSSDSQEDSWVLSLVSSLAQELWRGQTKILPILRSYSLLPSVLDHSSFWISSWLLLAERIFTIAALGEKRPNEWSMVLEKNESLNNVII